MSTLVMVERAKMFVVTKIRYQLTKQQAQDRIICSKSHHAEREFYAAV